MASTINILTPNAMLGYGYRRDHFWYGVDTYSPHAIIVDSGSTDGGPYKLGMNRMTCGRDAYVRDLTPILEACYYRKIQVLISSAGGDGSNSHVDELLGIVKEILVANNFSLRIATIKQEISRSFIKQRITDGKCSPCGPVEDLTTDEVDAAVEIVAQMGAEPFMEALKLSPDIIISGRAYDPAPFAAFCMNNGIEAPVAWHMGKILECGGICAVPKGRSMIAKMSKSSFELIPLSPLERCTPLSVAAHSLYEKTRPDRLPGPGGALILDNASYMQLEDDRTIRVSGSRFVPTPVYQIKLEGVRQLGYRTIFIGGVRDPILISQIDDYLEKVRDYSKGLFPELDTSEKCRLIYHVYGKNAVMGPLEKQCTPDVHELGIMGEVVAETQERSHAIANNVRTSLLHMPYEGQLATTGNFASPLSPHEQAAGGVFKFNIYHLIDLSENEQISLFPISLHEVKSEGKAKPEPTWLTNDELLVFKTTKPVAMSKISVPKIAAPMKQIAKIIRSKNSGPFELTLDIMFDQREAFERVRRADVLTNSVIRDLYQVKDEHIITNMYFEPALAWKCTLKRPWAQGSVGERDTLGTQQHAPLLDIVVPAL
ncbi:hypothetical protein EJ05DRAFT_387571 [Pseudovirgaria hyperparasitica]|uniref:DUF1446-domain-containing protein n=1 Tax=Pseudovirgaria hyperparasitica TaxID=470096 RepID=A0A6A6W472_9PEZI|nr:uncharacterized protein EJ05DRAFT_387571 [Pseudovirgaria hyperparasitica]KAF2757355.1 hypothetical protein EJ05DRAFT_387571 [Pseudovirgaria hyperparasitica]